MKEQWQMLVDNMAKPKDSLGTLEEAVVRLYEIWQEALEDAKPYHIVFAADNGIAEEAVIRQPVSITALQSRNMVRGPATISSFCAYGGIPYEVVDVGIRDEERIGIPRKIRKGTSNFLREPAMTKKEWETAAAVGEERVCAAKEKGYRLLSFGEMGIGNTTTSAAVMHALTKEPADTLAGYGAGPALSAVRERKIEVIQKGVARHLPQIKTAEDAIRCVGGFDIAALYGAMRQCKKERMPFVIDGFITAAALCCAEQMDPGVKELAFVSHISREPGMQSALKQLQMMPSEVPLHLNLALGEGTGAVLWIQILQNMLYAVRHTGTIGDIMNEAEEREKISAVHWKK